MAKLTEKLSQWFRSSKSDEEDYYDDEQESTEIVEKHNTTDPLTTYLQPTAVAETPITNSTENSPAPDPGPSIPYWLEDEATLRDEGVLFGLSESDPQEKTEIIHKYFSQLSSGHIADIEQQNERIQELNLFIGQKSQRMEDLSSKFALETQIRFNSNHHLPRTLIGLSLCIIMCTGNFYLIKESLEPVFKASGAISIGVFLAGMFSLFGRISMFHDNDSKVTWRSLLEEIGLPFAASLFVFTNALTYQTFWQALALFVFVFFLFLFAGKLLLSNITLLRNDLKIWIDNKNDKEKSEQNCVTWEEDILRLEEEIDELRVKKWQALKEQRDAEIARDKIFAKRDMLIKLFESEFYLARRMKNELTSKQIKYISGNRE